jgi:hypothetical protein
MTAACGASVSISNGIPYVATHVRAAANTSLRASLSASAPVGGRLLVEWDGSSSQMGLIHAAIRVDVGADGSIEAHARWTDFVFSTTTKRLEVPVLLVPNGVPVQIDIDCSADSPWFGNWNFASTSLAMRIEFFPGQAAVTEYDTTGAGAGLLFSHLADDTITLDVPGILVLGATPMVQPIPGFPGLVQLVSADVVVPATSIHLPMPRLPPGSALYAQGIGLSSSGTLVGSRSLRALLP